MISKSKMSTAKSSPGNEQEISDHEGKYLVFTEIMSMAAVDYKNGPLTNWDDHSDLIASKRDLEFADKNKMP